MAPVGEGCYAPPSAEARRPGGHQLPESPPDSGSENPYSPDALPLSVPTDYMLIQDLPSHEMLAQSGDYIYEELKSDDVLRSNLGGVVVLNHDLGLESMYQNR
ncbi:Oxidoreductase alpha (Molybdopterin) subunit [Operophtera brumata]|uniref:Oxidoreductase alpha (Molybdopterin) subunit n=1 Tax=Operophtera brumata TaxID=104452 RepID=A0A0L7LHY5_OPEBR|nr:Oxidoreductase alpha (Molybdopterin) subunit [Operophtera brumata]